MIFIIFMAFTQIMADEDCPADTSKVVLDVTFGPVTFHTCADLFAVYKANQVCDPNPSIKAKCCRECEIKVYDESISNRMEVSVFIDKKALQIYKGFGYSNSAARKTMKNEIIYYFKNMNGLYDSLKPYGVKLQLFITSITFINSVVSGADIINGNQVNASRMLNKFIEVQNSETSDLAVLYTGFDLTDPTSLDTSNAGLANIGVVCNSHNAAIIEMHGSAAAIGVGAHEIGHALGANHDVDTCGIGYVMFPSQDPKSPNHWSFSECSANYFKNYIASLGSGKNCMLDFHDGSDKYVDVPANLDIEDPAKVCGRIDGTYGVCTHSQLLKNLGVKDCYLFACKTQPSGLSCQTAVASEGMKCGNTNDKRCHKGMCTDNLG